MYITFNKLTYKNFLTVGQAPMEIDLNDAPTTIITGKNGDGKSTMIDALHFVLYNKAFRKVNKTDLVNWTNKKNCLVTLELTSGSKKYKIVRGIAPTKFEIWEEDEGELKMIEQDSSSPAYQKMLEFSIVKMTQETFRQIVILGSTSFTPFMRLSKPAKTSVIEDLLDIQVFTKMLEVAKGRAIAVQKTVSNLDNEQAIIDSRIVAAQQYIDRVEKVVADRVASKEQNLAEQENKIGLVRSAIDQIKSDMGKLEEDDSVDTSIDYAALVDAANEQITKLAVFQSQFQSQLKSAREDQKFYSQNQTCGVCGQVIAEDFREDKISKAESTIEKAEAMYEDVASQIVAERGKVNQNQHKIREIAERVREANRLTTNLRTKEAAIDAALAQIESINNQDETVDTSKEKAELDAFLAKNDKLAESREELDKKDTQVKFVVELLKKGEIRKEIVAKYLPVINSQIATYLDIMEFPIQFVFDEEFVETISVGKKVGIGYNSLSEGQKMRVDLAVLFSFRDIAALKNSTSCNLLIFDEIADSSLDGDGQEAFKRIIIDATLKGSNIILISHNQDTISDDSFSNSIHYKRVNGFTVAE